MLARARTFFPRPARWLSLALPLLLLLGGSAAASEKVYDFIISGAGPGGLATALELTKQSLDAGRPGPSILILENRQQEGTRNNPLGYHNSMLNRLKYLGADFDQADSNFVKVREYDTTKEKWVKIVNLRPADVKADPGAGKPWHVNKILRQDMTANQLVPINEVERVMRESLEKHPSIEVRYQTGIGSKTPFEFKDGQWTIGAYQGEGRGVDADGNPGEHATLHTFRARKVVGADGFRSMVRRRLQAMSPAQAGDIPLDKLKLEPVVPEGELQDSRMIVTVKLKDPNKAALYRGWSTRIKTPHGGKVYVWGGKETAEFGVDFPRDFKFSADPATAAQQREKYFWSVLKGLNIVEPHECDIVVKPSFFMQKPMYVQHTVDPAHASFFLVGDAARGAHAATAAGAQAAAIDGARVAKAWIMETAEGKSARQVAVFYQRGTMATTRGIMKKAMPWFKPEPQQYREIGATDAFPHLDLAGLWKTRHEHRGWDGNTMTALAKKAGQEAKLKPRFTLQTSRLPKVKGGLAKLK